MYDKIDGSIEEAVVVEMVTSLPQLKELDQDLYMQANFTAITYSEFVTYVERKIGGYFDNRLRDQLSWDAIAIHWWRRREVMQPPDSGTYYLAGRI